MGRIDNAEVTLVIATLADAPVLLDIQIRAFHDDSRLYPQIPLSGPPGYNSLKVMQQDLQQALYYAIKRDGQIVGGAGIFERGNGHFHLHTLYIDPRYHNLGIGTRAMQQIETLHLAVKWTLDTPTYALRNQHFYEKLGYVPTGERAIADDSIILIAYEKSC